MKFIYLIIILSLGIFYVMYKPILSLYALITAIAFPIVTILPVIIFKRRLKFKTFFSQTEKDTIETIIDNPTIIPFSKLTVVFNVQTPFSRPMRKTVTTAIFPTARQTLKLKISNQQCIYIKIRAIYAYVSDPLCLFKFKIKLPKADNIASKLVYSKFEEITEKPQNNSFLALSNAYTPAKTNQNTLDISDLHEYQNGDRLNHINWKMSAKHGKILVKDFCKPIKSSILLCLNLFPKDEKNFWKETDRILRSFVSVAYFLLKNNIAFSVLLPNKQKPVVIENAEVMQEVIRQVMWDIEENPLDHMEYSEFESISKFVYFTNLSDVKDINFISEKIPTAQITVIGNVELMGKTQTEINTIDLSAGSICDIINQREVF